MNNLIEHYFVNEFKVLEYDALENTMDIIQNHNPNTVIMTRNQKKAKGKYDRKWSTFPGNLFFSFILDANKKLKDYSQLSFLSSVAMRDTIINLVDSRKTLVQCKWPNDILINDKKVCGILLQFEPQKNSLITGIGVNVKHFPKDAMYKATSIHQEGFTDIEVSDVLRKFLSNFSYLYKIWNQEGLEKIRDKWLKNAYKLNDKITVKSSKFNFKGIFKDLDVDGTLLLKTDTGQIKKIKSGDIF